MKITEYELSKMTVAELKTLGEMISNILFERVGLTPIDFGDEDYSDEMGNK